MFNDHWLNLSSRGNLGSTKLRTTDGLGTREFTLQDQLGVDFGGGTMVFLGERAEHVHFMTDDFLDTAAVADGLLALLACLHHR